MRLRKFLIILGLWIAILPHAGFSITVENILFSITGFFLIISSFYLAALEDKHKNKRVIKNDILDEASQKAEIFLGQIQKIKKQTIQKITPEKKSFIEKKDSENKNTKIEQIITKQKEGESESFITIEQDDGRPKIKKAVSDVKIKADSIDDIVS